MKRRKIAGCLHLLSFGIQFQKTLQMIYSTPFAPRIFSSTSQNPSKTLRLQSLLKSGFSPTLQILNRFLLSLYRNRRYRFLLHIFSQMSSNKIKGNSLTHSIISLALLKENKFKEAYHFITEMRKNGFFRENGIWNSLIQGFCNSENGPERAFSLLQECIRNNDILPSSLTFYSLIYSFSSLGKMDRAIEVLELMTEKKVGYPFDNFICSSIISGFCRIGKAELALGFYENADKTGTFEPNVVTYTAVVDALCKEGKVQEVSDLISKMEKEGVVLDVVFYSSWICGYLRDGMLAEAFQKHRVMTENGIKPDCVSYTILIDGFCKEGNVEKAVGFLHEMKEDGLNPNLVTYTAIMRGFCKIGKVEEAFGVFRKIEKSGFRADEVTYATLIDGLCRKGNLDNVFKLLAEMEDKGINAGIVTYNTVINGLCKVGKTSEADEISKGMVADNFSYSTLIHGYIMERNIVGMLETKRRLEEAGVCMDVVTCNVLIKALFMVGRTEDASMLFKGMPDMGLVADIVTYCIMIDGYCTAGRIGEALETLDSYRRTSLVTSLAIYNCIIRGLCQDGMVEMAVEVFNELIEKGLAPDAFTYMMVMKSKFMDGHEEGVLEFLQGIEELDHETRSLIYNDAISFLCQKGSSEAALNVYMVMRREGLPVISKSYYSILKKLLCNGTNQLVPLMLNACIKEYGIQETRISKIVLLYLCKMNVKEALQFLSNMGEESLHLSFFTAIVNAFTNERRVQDAHKLVMQAEENGIVVDVVAYSVLVDGFCKEGYLEKALDLCASMKKKGICPNIVTYNSVINGLCQQGCLVEAFRLFNSLEENNMFPTFVTYATLISALSKEGFLEDAKNLFQKMVLKGFIPNTRVYNLLINGYCRFGLVQDALKLLHDLERGSLQPDVFTVSAVVNGFCQQGDMEAALEFFSKYQRRGIVPDLLGFINMIKVLCAKGRMEEARSILRVMLQNQSVTTLINKAGDEVNAESLTSFLGTLCEQGHIQEATDVLNEVGSMVFPFGKSYRNIGSVKLKEKPHRLEVLGRHGKMLNPETGSNNQFAVIPHRNADHSLGCKFTVENRSDLSFSKVGNKDSDKKNYAHFKGKSLLQDFDACYSVIASLCSKGKLEEASRVIKDMLLSP